MRYRDVEYVANQKSHHADGSIHASLEPSTCDSESHGQATGYVMQEQSAEMPVFSIRPLVGADRSWVAGLLREQWGDTIIVARGRVHQADALPGFAAIVDQKPAGLITYHLEGDACEIVSLNSLLEHMGIGSALIAAVRAAVAGCCTRIWLITTNDNMHALRFYQRHGFRLAALYPNALDLSRRLKPSIPLVGLDGIPLRDEIELDAAV